MKTVGKGVLFGCGGLLALGVVIVAAVVLLAGAAADSSGRVKAFTVRIETAASERFIGDIGVIDPSGHYTSQSVAGVGAGQWTVSGHSVTVTAQRQGGENGLLTLTIGNQSQQTSAPFGVVTLTAR